MAKKKKYMPEVVNKVIESGNHWESCAFDLDAEPPHKGEDIINRTNETKAKPDWIVAIEQGKVYKTGYGTKAGYYVYIRHQNGYYSFYCHLEKGTILVKKNEMVRKGQRLAYMGESGKVTGPHLHLGVLPNLKTYVDPYPYLTGELNFDGKWTAGTYRTIKSKFARKQPKVSSTNKIKVKEVKKDQRYKLTSTKLTSYAKLKIGVEVNITGFATDSKGYIWGKIEDLCTNQVCYICVYDNTGNQVIKI